MKKIILLVAAALIGISANAQWFAGGSASVSFDSNTLSKDPLLEHSTFNLYIAPQIGYNVNDDLAIGATLSITPGFSKAKESIINPLTMSAEPSESKTNSFRWSVNPYIRYRIWSLNKFSLCGQAGFGIGTTKYGEDDEMSVFTADVYVLPVITYSMNERFTLLAYMDMAELSFSGQWGDNSSYRNFGLNAASLGQLASIGFQYNF